MLGNCCIPSNENDSFNIGIKEDKGVLIVLTCFGMIVFHLIVWTDIATKILKPVTTVTVLKDMLRFSYPSLLSRHEVSF